MSEMWGDRGFAREGEMTADDVRRHLAELTSNPWQSHTPLVVQLVLTPRVGVEVGVAWGWTSAALLLGCPDLTLYMVDAWWKFPPGHPYVQSGDLGGQATQEHLDAMMANADNVTKFAENRRHILRMTSAEAALRVSDGSLDFCFIDADHTYEGVMYDLIAWYPKVRDGGMIFGHDYGRWGVQPAVDEFAAGMGVKVRLYPETIWTIVKHQQRHL